MIPHLLTRLRTLSTLHASAAGFASELAELEEEQRKTHASLEEISRAIEGLEKSFTANSQTVAGNLEGLQARLEDVQGRLVNSQR
jgi:nuclear migration protein JNM1